MDQRTFSYHGEPAAGGSAAPQEAAGGGGAPIDPAEEAMDMRYRMMLLEHWKSRVSIGNLREHEHSVPAKVRANFRKRRKLAGHTHPQFDEPPPLFTKFTFLGHGMGDSSDEDDGAQASSSVAPAGVKKARSGKPKRDIFRGDDVPFGSGPLSIERRTGWAAVMKQIGQKFRDLNKFTSQQQMDAKKCVQMCQKRFRKDALATLKTSRDFAIRAKKLARESGMVWRRERAAILSAQGIAVNVLDLSRSKKETREFLERKKQEEAERERVRQQKRINFLLTQTELFAHFIGQKMGGTLPQPAAAGAAAAGATGATGGAAGGAAGGGAAGQTASLPPVAVSGVSEGGGVTVTGQTGSPSPEAVSEGGRGRGGGERGVAG
mmetsp:Transcript_8746/g.20339  ORF Transcript_8746/g.20339 Transcript_8746/m.20339 type:complete len:377 (-) Transcript_8746:959-2089(-)